MNWWISRSCPSLLQRNNRLHLMNLPSSSTVSKYTTEVLIDCKDHRTTSEKSIGKSTDYHLNLALKSCIESSDYQSGIAIHKKLSEKSLQNSLIQYSLIEFYSKYTNDHFELANSGSNEFEKFFSEMQRHNECYACFLISWEENEYYLRSNVQRYIGS